MGLDTWNIIRHVKPTIFNTYHSPCKCWHNSQILQDLLKSLATTTMVTALLDSASSVFNLITPQHGGDHWMILKDSYFSAFSKDYTCSTVLLSTALTASWMDWGFTWIPEKTTWFLKFHMQSLVTTIWMADWTFEIWFAIGDSGDKGN